jgi:hypothetical protein
MERNDLPAARPVLFVNRADRWLHDPQTNPFTTTMPCMPDNTMAAYNPYAQPYIPREFPAPAAEPADRTTVGERVRGYLQARLTRWVSRTAPTTIRTGARPAPGGPA